MRNKPYCGSVVAGLAAGAVTGLFGAGGGMVLVPLLTLLTPLQEQQIFPTSICVILPICIVSLTLAFFLSSVSWGDALPYLLGSAAGGFLAGKFGQHIGAKWLHRILGLLILWGGWRYLC